MLLLGVDIGTSFVKVSVVDAETQVNIVSVQYPEIECPIISRYPGWAEQSPEIWWENVQKAILKAHATKLYQPSDIAAIGIAYQMHGLVLVDKSHQVLRDAIIWCDDRAVETGKTAFSKIGREKCLSNLLNSPGNFTASKLAWVKQNEPHIYEKVDKIMLPGDFIAMKLTREITTTISALSEGIFWDFKKSELSNDIMSYFRFDTDLIPTVKPVFSEHGKLAKDQAAALSLRCGIPVSYKSGDQPNNALSLNVLRPGEVAATAGTSGVVYAISDNLVADPQSRINTFAHVNHTEQEKRLGLLMCINGAGILNHWTKSIFASEITYNMMNIQAKNIRIGSDGLQVLPFGNGAERMLENRKIGAHYHNINFNIHTQAHVFRAVQEGIAFAFRYGLDILRENGINPEVIRAGQANLFLSDLFTEAFANSADIRVELYRNDGSVGAALGSGIGLKVFSSFQEVLGNIKAERIIEPSFSKQYEQLYQEWKELLVKQINTTLT